MSMLRTLIVVGAAVMLLPVDAKKQAEFSATASRAAAETATFCQRNVDTCATGRELWGLLVQKAEYGIELGASLVRAEIARTRSSEESATPAVYTPSSKDPLHQQGKWHSNEYAPYDPLPPAATASAQGQHRRNGSPPEHSSRWR